MLFPIDDEPHDRLLLLLTELRRMREREVCAEDGGGVVGHEDGLVLLLEDERLADGDAPALEFLRIRVFRSVCVLGLSRNFIS